MDAERMRDYLALKYPGWEKKLRKMPDNQVVAIYMRMQRTGPMTKLAATIGAGLVFGAVRPPHYIYECQGCYLWFESENPDIEECRYCGSPRSMLNRRTI